MVSTATAASTIDAEAFNQLVLERGLTPWKLGAYRYTGYRGPNGWELYRTESIETLDDCEEQTAVTANPAAGTLSIDVKTFTGRGRVTALQCTCVADATVATRQLYCAKVSGTNVVYLSFGATFVAAATGTLNTFRGHAGSQGAAYPALAHVEFAPGDILRVVVSTGQAGDDVSAITYSFKETSP